MKNDTGISTAEVYYEGAKLQAFSDEFCRLCCEDRMGIVGSEWENIQARIDKAMAATRDDIARELKGKKWPEWVKESLAMGIVMAGASFMIAHYIPAAIHTETESQSSDISSLKTSVEQIKQDVRDVKTDIKDTLNRALDHAISQGGSVGGSKTQGAATGEHSKRSSIDVGASAIKLASDLGVKLDTDAVSNFGQKVAQASIPQRQAILKTVAEQLSMPRAIESADYWPAVLRFVQSASAASSSFVPQWGHSAILYPPGTKITGTGAEFPAGDRVPIIGPLVGKILEFDGGEIRDVTFIKCKIEFTNKPVQLSRVTFIDCVFVLPVTKDPPIHVRQVAQQILASDFKTVTVPPVS